MYFIDVEFIVKSTELGQHKTVYRLPKNKKGKFYLTSRPWVIDSLLFSLRNVRVENIMSLKSVNKKYFFL